ncbi:sensor histidine kinase [Streptococcus ictaluri]
MSYFRVANMIVLTNLGLFSFWKYHSFRKKIKILQEFIYVKELDPFKLPNDLAYKKVIVKLKEEEADKLLSQLNQQKKIESLIKMWSHQMKLPLSALSLMIQTNNSNLKDYHTQVLRLEKYLNNLLSFLKFNQGQDDFRFQSLSVNDIIKSIVKQSSQVCIAKDISLQINGDWQLNSDKKWLSFALTQVIDNAIKYTKQGGHIAITIQKGSITISDDGIGILEEDLPRLFEEGFTGYNGHEHQKATGLGLFMTKEVLNKLNMDIIILTVKLITAQKLSSVLKLGTQK